MESYTDKETEGHITMSKDQPLETPQTVETPALEPQPQAKLVGITRRESFGVLAGIGLMLFGKKALADPPKPANAVQTPSDKAIKPPDADSKTPAVSADYEKWAGKIDLPKIEFDENGPVWSQEQVNEYFLPKGIDRKRLEKFYEEFDNLLKDFEKVANEVRLKQKTNASLFGKAAIEMHKSTSEKAEKFFKELLKIYRKYINPRASLPVNYYDFLKETSKVINDINNVLIAHNNYLIFFPPSMIQRHFDINYPCVGFYKMNPTKPIIVKGKSGARDVPSVPLREPNTISTDPGYKRYVVPQYVYGKRDYIIFDRKNILDDSATSHKNFMTDCGKLRKQKPNNPTAQACGLDADTFARYFYLLTVYHEAMHAYMHIDPGKAYKKVKNKGTVHLGNFALKPEDYKDANIAEGGELGGIGFSLMNSGPIAKMYVWDITNFSQITISKGYAYSFAKKVLTLEVMNSPYVSDDLKKAIQNEIPKPSPKQSDSKRESIWNVVAEAFGPQVNEKYKQLLTEAILQIPDDELHRIGERMAKLALHLTK